MPRKNQSRNQEVDELLDRIQQKLGGYGVVLQRGNELEARFDLRRPCGIPSLDIATGGGLPPGLSQIDGPEGTGKNLLVYHYFAKVQQIYGADTRIFMLCMEFPFDKMFARKVGFRVPFSDYEIDVEQRSRAARGEPPLTKKEIEALQDDTDCGLFVVPRGTTAESQLEASIDLVDSQLFQIGAIDSWDSMLTVPEEETPLGEDPRLAAPASVQTRWMKMLHGAMGPKQICPQCKKRETLGFKRTTAGGAYFCECGWRGERPLLKENETTIIGIRQVRANMHKAGLYSREWRVGGSYALKHGKMIDIQLRPGAPITDASGKIKIGKEVHWEITKGKAGTHEGKTGTFKYYFDPPEIDVNSDMFGYCLAEEIILRAGSTYEVPELGVKLKGQREVMDALDNDTNFRDALWKLMLKKAGLSHIRHKN